MALPDPTRTPQPKHSETSSGDKNDSTSPGRETLSFVVSSATPASSPQSVTVENSQHPSDTPPKVASPESSDSSASHGSSSLDRYEFRRQLGSGGFGTVCLAWDTSLHREVAIKRPAPLLSSDFKQAFLKEARLAARVRHPGIVVVHDVGTDATGDPFIIYEFMPGATLRERMASNPFTIEQALDFALAIAEALAAAHRQGLTHRDLKPANVLLDESGRPHVADFGLATEHDQQNHLRGQVAGTNRYMSPEQVRGEANHLDGRTDLWSLGVMLYEMLTRKHPFPGNKEDVSEQILKREPRPPRQWQAEIPRNVENIVLKLLSKPIAQRYASASDLAADLRACLTELRGGESVSHSNSHRSASGNAVTTILESPHTRVGSGQVLLGALLALVVLTVAVIGGAWLTVSWLNPTVAVRPPDTPPRTTPAPVDELPLPSSEKPSLSSLPPSDRDFPIDVWIKLLKREPWPILIRPVDRQVFAPGEVWINANYQVLLQLGTTKVTDYSYRMTIEPDKWNGEAGLFIGYGPSLTIPDIDVVTLLGVQRDKNGAYLLMPRRMEIQRSGEQYPRLFEQFSLDKRAMPTADQDRVTIQVDIRNGQIAALFLENRSFTFPPDSKIIDFPTQGKFGVFSFERTCTFSDVEIRIIHQDSKP